MGVARHATASSREAGIRGIGLVAVIALLAGLLSAGPTMARPEGTKRHAPTPTEDGSAAITFTLPLEGFVGEVLALEAIADPGPAVEFRSETPDVCSVHRETLRLDAEGTCTIAAFRPGNGRHASTAAASSSMTVSARPELEGPTGSATSDEAGLDRGRGSKDTRSVDHARGKPPAKARSAPVNDAKPQAERTAQGEAEDAPTDEVEPKAGKAATGEAADEPTDEVEGWPADGAGSEDPAGPGVANATAVSTDEPEAPTGTLVLPAADGDPQLTVTGGYRIEGNVGTEMLEFSVKLSAPSSTEVTFWYGTADDTATAGSDYVAKPYTGPLVLAPGETTTFIYVTVNGDAVYERNERFELVIGSLAGATYDAAGSDPFGYIVNDDTAPQLLFYGGIDEEGDSGTTQLWAQAFVIGATQLPVTFDYSTQDQTAVAPVDYVAASGTVTILPGSESIAFPVSAVGDTWYEDDEYFEFLIQNLEDATLDPGSDRRSWILNDDAAPVLTITGEGVTEGNEGTLDLRFVVSLSAKSALPVSFYYQTQDDTATAGSDYVARSRTQLVLAPGTTSAVIYVTVNGDGLYEIDERFKLAIDSLTDATYDAAGSDPYGVIRNDDSEPRMWVSERRGWEGDAGTQPLEVVVVLSEASGAPVTFQYRTEDASAVAGEDYVAVPWTTGSITPGQLVYQIPVAIIGDTRYELDESFRIALAEITGAALDVTRNVQPYGTIWDDDEPPSLSLHGTSDWEGDSGTTTFGFDAYLSEVSGIDATFDYSTEDITAAAGDDYVAVTGGSMTIPAGQTHTSFTILVYGDTDVELDESFQVRASNIVGATEGPAGVLAFGEIRNDDGLPTLSLWGYGVYEGDSGTTALQVDAILSHAPTADVTFTYETVDDTATAPLDYVYASDTVTIPAGEIATTISVQVNGDTAIEPEERFTFRVGPIEGATYDAGGGSPFGVIQNDDYPAISVGDLSVDEGAGQAVFSISLSASSLETASVDYATADGTASAPDDFGATSGTLVFAPGQVAGSVSVPIVDDALDELDETFTLVLSGPDGATIADASGTATIWDDDGVPVDAVPPTVTAPDTALARSRIRTGATPIPVRVSFTAQDPGGIVATHLQYRRAPDAFGDVALPSATATSASLSLATNGTTVHAFRARATDGAGNTSGFVLAPSFKVKVIQDGSRSIKSRGTWARKAAKGFFGGSVRQATKAGATQKVTAYGTDFAIVTTRGRDRGKATVLLDGKPVANLDLYARQTKTRQVVYSVSLPTAGKHTITLKATGKKRPAAKGTRVDLDAFVVLVP